MMVRIGIRGIIPKWLNCLGGESVQVIQMIQAFGVGMYVCIYLCM